MRVEHEYDVPPSALLAVLTDEDFLAARSARYGGNGDPAVDRAADLVVVTVPRKLRMDAVPGPFRRFAGSGELVQTDTWTQLAGDRISGTWRIDPGDTPLRLAGCHEITATTAGSRYVVTAEVKVNIRFVGGQAEGVIRDQLTRLIGEEQAFAETWLDEHR
ncbi:MAG: DUF2505 domain-containing protein [Pseudonocardiales bacterium]